MIAFAALAPIAMKIAGPMIAQAAGPLLSKLMGGIFGGNNNPATSAFSGSNLSQGSPLQNANPTQMLARGIPGMSNGAGSILGNILGG